MIGLFIFSFLIGAFITLALHILVWVFDKEEIKIFPSLVVEGIRAGIIVFASAALSKHFLT